MANDKKIANKFYEFLTNVLLQISITVFFLLSNQIICFRLFIAYTLCIHKIVYADTCSCLYLSFRSVPHDSAFLHGHSKINRSASLKLRINALRVLCVISVFYI